jgi:hypothetical protein
MGNQPNLDYYSTKIRHNFTDDAAKVIKVYDSKISPLMAIIPILFSKCSLDFSIEISILYSCVSECYRSRFISYFGILLVAILVST